MPYLYVTELELQTLSKPMIGSYGPGFRITDHERFKAKFGVTTELCTLVWNMIVRRLNQKPAVKGFCRLTPTHVLYGLFFLKAYPTALQSVATLGNSVGQNQFLSYAKFIIRSIAALSNDVVSDNES